MTQIVAGRFQQQQTADAALRSLVDNGFDARQVTAFYVSPAGRHATFPIGGDRDVSPGAEQAGAGAGAGVAIGAAVGAAAGLAAAPVLGPLGVAAGAGVGAYVGSLHGALAGLHADEQAVPNSQDVAAADPGDTKLTRPSGMLVAVAAPNPQDRQRAVSLLRQSGALDIEASEGTIEAGDWTDFDPLRPVQLVP